VLPEDKQIPIAKYDEEGKEVYWHSTSHLMAHAILSIYPEAKFGVGPAIESGFYYDFDINTKLSENDLQTIENKMIEIAHEDNSFERVELTKDKAISFFKEKGDEYKLEILSGINENDETISIYNEGKFTDLCTSPSAYCG
jgi:threonyl-tRNA synthetase